VGVGYWDVGGGAKDGGADTSRGASEDMYLMKG